MDCVVSQPIPPFLGGPDFPKIVPQNPALAGLQSGLDEVF
jgi:hypothetical protein